MKQLLLGRIRYKSNMVVSLKTAKKKSYSEVYPKVTQEYFYLECNKKGRVKHICMNFLRI